ncbi:metalloprotease TIKI1-like isoform X2 [Portunus trituberculatus]|uniref:metalloprotease TIKI1-like isoform X2 n=1 Tax=Portunus trituberculatus TaxID=210409 RepID=UPI001E1D2175|nr:metalloprotease TIKI1-like isoform X2 [Portunus trituberculatus]
MRVRVSPWLPWWTFCCVCLLQSGVTEAKRHRRPDYCEDIEGNKEGSFLWMVKRDPPSYFFGTIHVPYTRVWEHIPNNTKRAFRLSDNVFFELDLTDPYTVSALTTCQLLPRGENLSDVLPGELFTRLKRHLAYVKTQMPRWITQDQRGRGLYADYLFNAITGNWERKRPVWVMLMVNSLTESDIRSRGVPVLDLYLAQEAERLTKQTGAVERVEEQCVPLNGLNFSQVVFALNHTLAQQEILREGDGRLTYTTDHLITHYNCGNLDAVIFSQDTTQVPHLGNTSLPPVDAAIATHIDEYFREELIYRRNKRMGHRVVEILRANPDQSFFFAFGAGHFLGNHTVLDVVRAAGLAVQHVGPETRIKRHKRKRGGHRGGLVPEPSVLKDFTSTLDARHQHDPAFAKFLSEQTAGGGNRWRMGTPTTTQPFRKHAQFNDLWVRIDPEPPMSYDQHSSDYHEATTNEPVDPRDEELVRESLRVWYGLPAATRSASPRTAPPAPTVLLLLLLLSVLLATRLSLPQPLNFSCR